MPRFGVFFVPPARSPFFRLGTSVIGYDARRQSTVPEDNFIRKQLPDFDIEYIKRPYKHGIHCTLTAPQTCRYGDLDSIHYEIERILSCFDPSTVFEMNAKSEFVAFWGKKQQITVLQYEANPALLMLHTLLVSQLAKYITPDSEPAAPLIAHKFYRIKHFNYPFVFDGFTPHFTLLFPYKGDNHDDLREKLYGLFSHFKKQVIESICLMVQADTDAHWHIHREYERLDYPLAME